ncbi:alcohol dehydrogenase catalytic domain-containing protein [Candidatus Amarobacter glycogenicus]|uniref:alcohol dehydrogenase catalytic domain-containing protein n=1 Tax=Candidatus Amarobacter glycogenicus TaxID=3140699 RepID=UPI002A0EAD1D|nr:alcohol dehydrogenase catalytic domain-containing protein [Dehalococcoidia bacterium]
MEDVPKPAIGPDEALVKVSNANICGTDSARIYKGGRRHYPPGAVRIPGTKWWVKSPPSANRSLGYEIGQRVFVAPNMGSSRNRATISGNNNMDPDFQAIGINLDGAFAEFMRVPAPAIRQGNLMPISEAVDPAVAA